MEATVTRGTSATVEVPAVGGDVEVRLIPTKLLREIRVKATKRGRLDFQELMVWKLVYGLRHPNFTEAEARRVTSRFTLKTLQPIVDRIDELSGTDEHLRGCSDNSVPQRLRRYAELMVMATAWLQRFPDTPSRVPRTARARGAGRPAGRRSSKSSRAGPADDSDPPEPPPAGRRICECKPECGADISHRAPQARYLNDTHGATARQRRKRALSRDWNPDTSPRDFIDQAEYERLRTRFEGGCRCNGHHILDETGAHCIKCGHDRGSDPGGRSYIWARSAETRRARKAAA